MAETTGAGKKGGAAPPAEEERTPTKRTVLKRERVLVFPDTLDEEQVAALLKAVSDTKIVKSPQTTPAWLVVGEFEGESKRKAIEAHAGEPDTPTAKPGVYKAPPSSAFAGGRIYERPPETKVEAADLED